MFQKQPMMRRVLYSLVPIFLYSSYLYGWRVIVLTVIVFTLGILTEYIFEKKKNKKVSEAVLVTCALYTLSMPPLVPFWMAGIGIIFAVIFAKEVYGGFGRNIFNPAISGRLFIYIAFTIDMQQKWAVPGSFGMIDSVTSATSLDIIKSGEGINQFLHLMGMRAGSIGESAIFLIIPAALYLIFTKTANWKIMLSVILSSILTVVTISLINKNFNITEIGHNSLNSLLTGSLIFVAVFIATDPITAPKNKKSIWIYGAMIGICTILIRNYSLFPEGTSFAILLGNTFAALLDQILSKKKKAAA